MAPPNHCATPRIFLLICAARHPITRGMNTTTTTRAAVFTSDGDTFRATGRDPVEAIRAAARKARDANKTVTGGLVDGQMLTGSDVRFVTHREEYPS